MTKTTQTTLLSIDQFAFNVGAHTKAVRENSLPFHTAFVKGDAAQQRDLRVRWMCNHMAGSLGIALAAATLIRDKGKGAGATKAHVAAIDRAYSDFRYYVVQNKAKGKDVTRDSITLTTEQRAAMKALDMSCGTIAEMKAVFAAYVANMKAE